VFAVNPFAKAAATAGAFYSASIATNAADPNADTVAYSKTSGPTWLSVAGNGVVSGTPSSADIGSNSFAVRATDPAGLFSTAIMTIPVVAAPGIVAGVSILGGDLLLSWSGGISPYSVQVTTNFGSADWQPVASGLTGTSLVVPRTNAAAFYRILGQ
jgi:hypothetical protein